MSVTYIPFPLTVQDSVIHETRKVVIETRFIQNNVERHTNQLGYDFVEMTLANLRGKYGSQGWSVQYRTIYTTVETTDWRQG
jgi:hypothetical protein